MFDTYNCKVRLGGLVTNEVPKTGVTAPEIEVLRELHGADAVVDVKKVGNVKRSHAEERQRLYAIYAGNGLAEQQKKKLERIRALFGHDRLPLPTSLEDEPEKVEDDEQSDPPAPVRRTRVAKQAEPAYTE